MRSVLLVIFVLTVVAGVALGVGLLRPDEPARQHRMAEVVQGDPIDGEVDAVPGGDGEDDTTGALAPGASGGAASAADPAKDALPAIDFQLRPEHADYTLTSFQALASFRYQRWWPDPDKPLEEQKPPDQIPAGIRALNGKKIAVVGFLNALEADDKGRASHFMLMRNQLLCCYGRPPTLVDWIDVRMKDNEKIVPWLHVPIFVLGTLEVGEENVEGYTISIYRMTAEKILPPGTLP